jgi:hypothetical protein
MEFIFDAPAAGSVSIGDASLVQQQGVDNSPPVLSSGPKVQQGRLHILEFAKKLQRVLCGRLSMIRLGLKPAIPLQKKEGFPFVISH